MSKLNNKKNINPVINIFLSIIIGNFIFIFLIALSALVIINIKINTSYLYLFVIFASSLGIFSASFITSRKSANKKFICGTAAAIILTIIHFLILLCFNNSDLAIKTYIIFPINMLTGTLGTLSGINFLRK